MEPRELDALSASLGSAVRSARPVSGGDINRAYELVLADGRRVFAKLNRRAPAGMFRCEASGLAWLAETGALRTPRVLAVGDAAPAFLCLEYLEPAPRCRDFEERLGRGLAALHRAGAPYHGLDTDNFLATLPQHNQPSPSWPAFYGQQRLEPLARQAIEDGRAPRRWAGDIAALLARLEVLCGPVEPPARLHGDLWSGNVHVDERGQPCLVDPAVYGGHREVDLAMLALFGGLSQRCLAAYDELYPLAAEWQERVLLYQLYPLLVHLLLFGGSYAGAVRRALDAYL
jgi:fructosamine-3-kinase